MRSCMQFEGMSVLDHGGDVRAHYVELRDHLLGGAPLERRWRLPDWIYDPVVAAEVDSGPDDRVVELYQTYHDCGKPLCLTVDGDGRRHYPDHAKVSHDRWLELSDHSEGALQVATLVAMDMDVHTLRPGSVEEFARRPVAVTLLLTGLSELHSNAVMFGGIDSVGFKIKYKALDRLGGRVVRQISEVRRNGARPA